MINRLSVVIAVAGIAMLSGSIYVMGVSSSDYLDMSALNSGTGIMGHVTLTVYDEFGNIRSYTQSDNTIVNEGENCIAEYMFGVSTACSGTPGTDDFLDIALGVGSAVNTNVRGTFVGLASTTTIRADAAAAVVSSIGADPTTAASDAEVTIETTFTGSTATYTDVVLANGKTTDVFAYQDMADATVGDADSVKVTWVITIN